MNTRIDLACIIRPFGLALFFTGAAALAQQPPGMAEINAQPDPTGTGPYPAMKQEVASLPEHVVYRPRDLDALGSMKLGVVAWGNGACSDDGASSRFHLLELASHGYLVIANGRILSGPGAPPTQPRQPLPEGQLPPPRTHASQLTEAIDWAIKENDNRTSPYYHRIDPNQIAVSGFSCGGIQALAVAGDTRIHTLVLQNTGIFNDKPPVNIPEMNLSKDALKKIHTPTIYILGGDKDIAYANGMDDFKRINHVPAAVANLLGAGHGGSYFKPNGGPVAQTAVHWLQWQLRGIPEDGSYFLGKDCKLCTDPAWSFESKGLK